LKTAVDSSVILSVFKGEARGLDWLQTLKRRRRESSLVICETVVAECRPASESDENHLQRLNQLGLSYWPMSMEAACHAGSIYTRYRESGGNRDRILPDFLIGAHALIDADELLTDDDGFMRKYFDGLRLVEREAR